MTKKVATIVGVPGMCSDDGRALTYGYRVQTNDWGGVGFYNEAGYQPDEVSARKWCEDHGYTVTKVAHT